MTLVHATGVVRDGWAALLTGPSGVGKSDLALRLVDRGWHLLADDYVRVARDASRLVAHAPDATRGLIEVRGLGILRLPSVARAPVALLVDLARAPERLPPDRFDRELGVETIALAAFHASAPIRVEVAFARARARLLSGR